MARIRTIKPELFLSETLAQLTLAQERSFVGLLTQADDKGRMRDTPAVLNGALWPLRPDHDAREMAADIDALIEVGVLCRYAVDGKSYLHFPTWEEHQKISKPSTRNLCPACPIHDPTGGGRPASPATPAPEPSGPSAPPALFDLAPPAPVRLPEGSGNTPEGSRNSREDSGNTPEGSRKSREPSGNSPEGSGKSRQGKEKKGKELTLVPMLSSEGGTGGERAAAPPATAADAAEAPGGARSADTRRTKTRHAEEADEMGVYDTPVPAFTDLRTAGAVKRGNGRTVGKNGIDPALVPDAERVVEHLVAARKSLGGSPRVTNAWWTDTAGLLRGTDARAALTAGQICDLIDFAAQDRFWHAHITDPKALGKHGMKLFLSDDFVAWSLAASRPAANRPRNNLIRGTGKPAPGIRGQLAADIEWDDATHAGGEW